MICATYNNDMKVIFHIHTHNGNCHFMNHFQLNETCFNTAGNNNNNSDNEASKEWDTTQNLIGNGNPIRNSFVVVVVVVHCGMNMTIIATIFTIHTYHFQIWVFWNKCSLLSISLSTSLPLTHSRFSSFLSQFPHMSHIVQCYQYHIWYVDTCVSRLLYVHYWNIQKVCVMVQLLSKTPCRPFHHTIQRSPHSIRFDVFQSNTQIKYNDKAHKYLMMTLKREK